MPQAKPRSELAESTQKIYAQWAGTKALSPRIKMALRMYAHGSCRTMSEACAAVGVNQGYVSSLKTHTPLVEEYMSEVQSLLDNKSVATSALMSQLGRIAIGKIATIMEDGDKEEHRLKAAIDLADRAPETSKIQKHQVESFTLSGKDVQALAEALVQGQAVQEVYVPITQGNFDKVGEVTNGRA